MSDHPDRLSQPAENPIPDQTVLKQELARTDRDFVTRLEEWRAHFQGFKAASDARWDQLQAGPSTPEQEKNR